MLKITAHQNLLQLKRVLGQISNEQFIAPVPIFNGSSIGMHVRHVLEFYLCLMKSGRGKVVNYDKRKRDPELENNTGKCVETIDEVVGFLDSVTMDFPLTLKANYSVHSDKEIISLESTFFRELLYNVEHTVHHLAIIKIGLKFLGSEVNCEEDFGISASTIRNKNICAQ